MLPDIDFDGKIVKPKNGAYRCPNKCSRSGYPQPTWKTEKGFRTHMAKCPGGSTFKAQAIATAQQKRLTANEFVASHPFKHAIGDKIFFVRRVVVKPSRDSRGRRVRYEDVYRFYSDSAVVKGVGASDSYGTILAHYDTGGWLVLERDLFPDMAAAERDAAEKQAAHDEHLRFSAMCR